MITKALQSTPNLCGRSFLSMSDITQDELIALLDSALALKLDKKNGHPHRLLEGKHIALYFELPSNRTRVSFEVGSVDLGLNTVHLRKEEINLGVRETIADTARTLSRYVDAIMIRAAHHEDVVSLAQNASVPVINGLTDMHHPCQVLADLLTFKEYIGSFEGKKLTYIGDGNNMCHSLLLGAALAGLNMSVATPPGYEPHDTVVEQAKQMAQRSGAVIDISNNMVHAVKGANAVYTDVWASMTNKHEIDERRQKFTGFEVTSQLMAEADPKAIVLHCLPACRGEEISAEIMDKFAYSIFEQAENRLHAQKALMLAVMFPQ